MLPLGNVYITDYGNSRIRKVTLSTSIITTIAGSGSNDGDGVQATSAALNGPQGACLDLSGIMTIVIYLISQRLMLTSIILYRYRQRVHR